MFGIIILFLSFVGTISWLWAGGIDYMNRVHPDYKGEDFLDLGGEEEKPQKCAWDDVTTEGSFD